MTPCALPEVSELLERFQVKKATVKTRLNDIVDDLFGEFLTEVARMSGKLSKCSCGSHSAESVASDTPSSHVEEVQMPQNLKVQLLSNNNGSKQSSNGGLETTIRNAQVRARELIKDEFYDSDPVSRLSQSSSSSLKPSSSTRSLPDNSADDEMDTPEITLTPIENVSSPAAALAAMVSSSREMTSILNGGGSRSSRSSNSDHHHQTSTSTTEKPTPNAHTNNNGHRKEDFDSEEEFEAEEQSSKPAANGVSKNSNNNNQQPPNQDETSQEEKSEDEEETKSPEHSNDPNEHSFTEKSLDELNSLCAGLPYAKVGGRYICKFQDCGQELKSRHNLLLHQRAHLGIRPYRCKWQGCSYNSNQSSAVIRHIRTKHFLLPLTMREQQMKKIEDDRDPKEFLEVVTPGCDGAISTTTASSSAATPESHQNPSSVEPPASSVDSLQSVAECDTPTTTNNNNGNYSKMLRSCRQAVAASTPTNGNQRGRRTSVLQQNSSLQPSTAHQQPQSLLMPQQQQTNGRSSGHKLSPPPPPSRPSHDESDEDEYDSEENDFEMIPMHQKLAFEMMQQQMQAAIEQQQQQQQMHQQQQQLQHQHSAAALLHSKSPFDYARKRRLESKIFANAALSNRNRLSGLGNSNNNNNGGSVDYYGGGKVSSASKRAKCMGSYGQQAPTTLEPLAAHSSSSSSSQRGGGGGPNNQHQYSFCPEEGCHSIFRTTIELDRHLTDVHCRLPQSKSSHLQQSSGPPKEPQTYSNLYICKWPKCPFSTVLHSSAINHVRGKHFNIPRTLTAQQRKFYANDTRNPNDYIKLLPFNPSK